MSDISFQAPSPEYLAGLLPQYDIESFIAQGGMGAVYKGRQISLDRDVAIKILPREMGEDPEFRQSFESEAKAMARLNHPNLLGVFDFGSAGGMPYIVMEYVHGKSLHESAWNQAIDPAQAVAIVKGICDGLAHAHGNGIVHRDIKPSNILLTQMAEPKIGDFGLAHAADSDKPGLVMGTPGYTAPEVFRDPNQAGPLADMYAVGVILHQLLTGLDPAGSMDPPSQVTGSPKLDAIWRKATQINPALRYPNIAAMATDLEAHLPSKASLKSASQSTLPTQPRRASSSQRGKPVRANKSNDHGVLLKLVLIGILAAAGFFTYRHLQNQKANAADGLVGGNGTEPVEPPPPEPASVPPERHNPDPKQNPDPVETNTREEPISPPIVETQPKKDPEGGLPLGDPELQARATGLIVDSRNKRDKELTANVRSLQSDLAYRARSANSDEARLIQGVRKAIHGTRLPIIADLSQAGVRLTEALKSFAAKQESIDATHLTDLIRIRDAYVTRLKGAAAAASDNDLKQRLVAQAESAGDVDAWIKLLAPEPEMILTKYSAVDFAGKWTSNDSDASNHWLARSDGTVEVMGPGWHGKWAILNDGSLEILFADKPKPNRYTRDGDGWKGETPYGVPSILTPGQW